MAPIISIKYESNFYFPGQRVKGFVDVTTDKEIWVKVIKLKAVGRSKVHWSKYNQAQHRNINYSEEEEYYCEKFNLFGNGTDAQLVPAGSHQYKFEFCLPMGIPASFESKYGKVRHACTASMDVKGCLFDIKQLVPFSVGSDMDLNQVPAAKDPIKLNERKSVTRIFSKSGHISFVVNIGHSGFVPGEHMIVNAEFSNDSDKATSGTKLKIKQEATFKTYSEEKTETSTVYSKTFPEVKSGGNDIWSGMLIKIPPLPPTGLPGCKIIDIRHELWLEFIPAGLSMTLEGRADLTIGAIPLKHVFEKFSIPSSPLLPPWAGVYQTLPAPCHESSALDDGNMEDDDENKPYVPSYVSYAWKEA